LVDNQEQVPPKARVPHIAPPPPEGPEPFISDSPETDPLKDRFRRSPFAKRIANTLAIRRDPTSMVLLINGKWGEGKTTLLEYVHGALQTFNNVVPIWFNPWRFSDETSLLLSFFATVADALDKSPKTKKEKLGEVIRDYGSRVSEMTIEVQGVKLSAGKTISKLGERLSTIGMEEKRDHFAEMLEKSQKRVVVFLDDIDRLDRVEVQVVFKLLKLTANFDRVSYVLAFDRDVVAAAIGQQFGEGDKQAGYNYLEKIVQVNLDLPVADRDSLAQLCIEGVNDALRIASVALTSEQNREFQLAFLQYIVPALNTPRLAKVYANSVAFVLPLLAREVNLVDILILEAIKFLYPLLHQDIRANPQIYTGEFGWDLSDLRDRGAKSKEHLSLVLEATAGHKMPRAQKLLMDLFPQLQEVFNSGKYGGGNDERAQREQRVSSGDYLWRYLTCSIPAGDISDQEVDSLLHAIPTMSGPDVAARYSQLIQPQEQLRLLTKLRHRAENIPAESAEKLAIAVAQHGLNIQKIPDAFVEPRDLAAFLIRQLISRVGKSERFDIAVKILKAAEPAIFAVMCLDFFRPQRDENSGGLLFSAADLTSLTKVVADKIALAASGTSVISNNSEETARLLTTWQEGCGSPPVKEHLRKVLTAEAAASGRLVLPFSSTIRSGMPGMDQAGYDCIEKFVDADVLIAAFRLSGLLDPSRNDETARIAKQYVAVHQKIQAP
jgi:predicted KAP-like P-loop ATPase